VRGGGCGDAHLWEDSGEDNGYGDECLDLGLKNWGKMLTL